MAGEIKHKKDSDIECCFTNRNKSEGRRAVLDIKGFNIP